MGGQVFYSLIFASVHGFHVLDLAMQGERPDKEKEKHGKTVHNQSWGMAVRIHYKQRIITEIITVIRKTALEGGVMIIIRKYYDIYSF